MEEIIQSAAELKTISDNFNSLSDYEKYIRRNKVLLETIYNKCLNSALNGFYSLSSFLTFRYNDRDKEHLLNYFKELGFNAELYEPGLIKGEKNEPSEEELQKAPYRQYTLLLSWS